MPFVIRKLDLNQQETFAYLGTVLERTPTSIVIEAFFQRADRLELGYTVFERGDRFVEYFYTDRWYNVFRVQVGAHGPLRGWYCNITRPAQIEAESVSAVDLALDVWIDAGGYASILDEDEFAALPLAPEEVARARAALAEVLQLARQHTGPFTPTPAP